MTIDHPDKSFINLYDQLNLIIIKSDLSFLGHFIVKRGIDVNDAPGNL